QRERRRSPHRGRQKTLLCLESGPAFPTSALLSRRDCAHLRGRNFVGNPKPRFEGFVYFGRTEQLKRNFLTTGSVNIENRRAGEASVLFEETQRLSILPERRNKARVLFAGELDDAQFRDHDRPAEDRSDCQQKQNKLAGNGSVFKRKDQTAGRNQRRYQSIHLRNY